MKSLLVVSAVLGGLFLGTVPARAHCDASDGPVARAAAMALEAGNVNPVLPYAPASAEAEIRVVFEQAVRVRAKDIESRVLADRHFLETVVRLHRQGEKAPFTGLKPAGLHVGPVIPAAEAALDNGDAEALIALLTEAVRRQVALRFAHALAARSLPQHPGTPAEVAAARERVRAELGFVLYAESVHLALKGETTHTEAAQQD